MRKVRLGFLRMRRALRSSDGCLPRTSPVLLLPTLSKDHHATDTPIMDYPEVPPDDFDLQEQLPEGSDHYGFQEILRHADDDQIQNCIHHGKYERAVSITSMCLRDRTLPLLYRWAFERFWEVEAVLERKIDLLVNLDAKMRAYDRMFSKREVFRKLEEDLATDDELRSMLGISIETQQALQPQAVDLPSLVQNLQFPGPDTEERERQRPSQSGTAEGAGGVSEEEAGSEEQ
ncbi:hypothetical protein HDK64DRAFT_255385 [Phyllosticta capitalensis]